MEWYETFEKCLRAGYTITQAARRCKRSRARAYGVWTTDEEWGERFDEAYKQGSALRTVGRKEKNANARRTTRKRKLERCMLMEDVKKQVVDEEMEWLLREYDLADGKITKALTQVGMAASTLYRRLKARPEWAEKFAEAGYKPKHRTPLSRGEINRG